MTSPTSLDITAFTKDALPEGVTKTSHSEIELYTKCQRAHYYAYGMELSGKTESEALARGTLGHAALAVYYTALKNGKPWEEAKLEAIQHVITEIQQHSIYDSIKMQAEVINLIQQYCDNWREEDEKLEIIAVEQEFYIPVGGDFYIKMYVDLIVRAPNSGIEAWDHKFVWDFFNPEIEAIMPQLPKYMGALRSIGLEVNKLKYNEVRYRSTKENEADPSKRFKRTIVQVNKARIINTMKEQIQAAKQIRHLRAQGLQGWSDRVLRAANSFICKNCAFVSICAADLAGKDTALLVEYNYAKRGSRDQNG